MRYSRHTNGTVMRKEAMKEISIDSVALEAISLKDENGLVDVKWIRELHAESCKLRDKISELYVLIGKKEMLLSDNNVELSKCYSEIVDKEAIIAEGFKTRTCEGCAYDTGAPLCCQCIRNESLEIGDFYTR